jgi:hypothetical protein
MIKLLPASVRVVLVAPSGRTLDLGRLPAEVQRSRFAARAVRPGCRYAPATAAGTAGVLRLRYASGIALESCYQGSLTVLRRGASQVTLVGADDPFRNDRIGEHGNAALATALLGTAPVVIWLDLHHPEKRPGYVDNPALAAGSPAPPSLGPGSPDPDFPLPDGTATRRPKGGQNSNKTDERNPLWRAFPPWVFAAVALIALAAVLLALARARRLGGPVAEPLPVTVRATETAEGRGRLYQRARARGPAARSLREHGRRQAGHLLGLGRDPEPATLVPAIAGATGWPPETVATLLYGPDPDDDRALVRLAVEIETLIRAVTHQVPGSAGPDAPNAHEGEPR